jgi:hypothetical protein
MKANQPIKNLSRGIHLKRPWCLLKQGHSLLNPWCRSNTRYQVAVTCAESERYWVYTEGKVRQVYRKNMRFASGLFVKARVVETQAPINPGDSGGPVVNGDGELVGVASSYRLDAQLISNCIDVTEVRRFAERTREALAERAAWPFAPTVIRFAPLNVLVPQLRTLAKLMMDADDYKDFDAFLREWIDSDKLACIDRKRPLAMYLSAVKEDEEPSGIVLVPVTDADKARTQLGALTKLGKPDGDGIQAFKDPDGTPMFLRFAHGYAWFALKDRKLITGRNLTDPARVLPQRPNRLLSVGVRLNNFPAALRKQVRDEAAQFNARMRRRRPARMPPLEALAWELAVEWTRWGLESWDHGQEVWLHANFDPRADEVSLEANLTGRRGSSLAAGITELGQAASLFHGVRGSDPALRVLACVQLPRVLHAAIGRVLDDEFPPRNRDAAVMQAKFGLFRRGEIDLFAELQGPGKGGTFTLVHGSRIEDGTKLETALRRRFAGSADVRFGVDQLGSLSVHRTKTSLLDPSGSLKPLLGNHPGHFVLANRVHLEAIGEGSMEALRRAADASLQAGPQLLLECAVGRLAGSPLNPHKDSRQLAKRLFRPGVPDRLQLTVEGGQALQVRLVLNSAVLKFLAELLRDLD